MKPTKKIESEVLKIYDTWLYSYLNGDTKTYNKYLDDEYHFIGSTNNEEFLNRKDTATFFNATADQLSGKAKMRNTIRTVESFDGLIFITDLFDAYILTGLEWSYYGRFRFSSILRKNKEGWRFIYQHFSIPDSKAQAGETMGTEKISKENQELREAIQRRTIELEQKNKELEVETALERVRSRSMAMHKSEELTEVGALLYQELSKLGIQNLATGYTLFDDTGTMGWNYGVNPMDGSIRHKPVGMEHKKNRVMKSILKSWKKNEALSVIQLNETETIAHQTFIAEESIGFPISKEKLLAISPKKLVIHTFNFKQGYLLIIGGELLNIEQQKMITRFATVFQQTYTRFQDLQKAEDQIREARIETALERMRAVALNIRTTKEVLLVAESMYNELKLLDFNNIRNAQIVIDLKENDDYLVCIHSDETSEIIREARYETSPLIQQLYNELDASHDAFYQREFKGAEFKKWLKWRKSITETIDDPILKAKSISFYLFSIGEGHLGISAFNTISKEKVQILQRFRNVFEMTYRRFIELQKAEAQSKEAKIEASLEKVRNVALSLTKSEDMLDIAKVLYEQLLELGFTEIRNAIIDIHNDDNKSFTDYDYSHDMSSAITHFSFYGDPVIEEQIKKIESSNDAFFEIELKGKQLDELIETRLRNGEKDDPRLRKTDHLTYNLYSFGNGAIGISNFGVLTEMQKKILKRFRNVFTFAYQRYSDLALAEVQARKAQIETGLETVRLRTMAMHSSDELSETAMVVFKQLMVLGIAPNRLYIGIINEDQQHMELWSTDEDGLKITNKTIFDKTKHDSFNRIYEAWKSKETSLNFVMEGKALSSYLKYLKDDLGISVGKGLSQKKRFQTVGFFTQGFIGIAAPEEQPEETTNLLVRFAGVFNLTYTRFKDLKIAEANAIQAGKDLILLQTEKKKAEDALAELQHTQKQLIQSEKMASLGELTAGIAHEIQNPLNFVNNFSDVSNELIDEMSQEIEKGDMEEAKFIMADIKSNLEKINHHGRRAEAIVKGMLQHSRTSTAEKEPTDINKLADEYLRLAYHGLRAKNRNFNATLKTDYDDSIGMIPAIPQDIGRVILNLITNAFYVIEEKKIANEKKLSSLNSETSELKDFKTYEPTVSVSTKSLKNNIIISVSDNGNGIPKDVLDKIFEPFFTTKPTGQGTGLGLSMSYDIVTKGHDGELTVRTKEGIGTTFTMTLPSNL